MADEETVPPALAVAHVEAHRAGERLWTETIAAFQPGAPDANAQRQLGVLVAQLARCFGLPEDATPQAVLAAAVLREHRTREALEAQDALTKLVDLQRTLLERANRKLRLMRSAHEAGIVSDIARVLEAHRLTVA